MLRALSEYVIGGLITNIPILKIIIANPSFRKGDFDINFLNDRFMNNLINMDEANKMKEIEKVSAIFAAILKSKSSLNNLPAKKSVSINQWQEQMHE